MTDISKMSIEELEARLAQKRMEKQEEERRRRAAYEGVRAQIMHSTQQRVETLSEDVKAFATYCIEESQAFKEVMAEYGQLRSPGQSSFTLREGNFKWEIKSNKVKRFDERADIAASRLLEFLKDWIKNRKDGTENPMYQLAMTLLERNKYGDLDYKSVSKLYDLESRFNNPEYSAIMQLFKESNIVEGTAINHYFYRRDDLGVWRKIEPSFNRLNV